MPAPCQHIDVGPDYQVYVAAGLMGNRLSDCAVAATDLQQSVPARMTYRDFSQWSQSQPVSAALYHANTATCWPTSGQQLAASCDANRSVWMSSQSPAVAVNGVDTQSNFATYVPPSHASQIYAQQAGSQMQNQFPTAVRFHAVAVPQVWMQPRQPQQQQQRGLVVCQNTVTLSPIRSASLGCVQQTGSTPSVWPPRFAVSPRFSNVQLPVTATHMPDAGTVCMSSQSSESVANTMAVAETCHMTSPIHSPSASVLSDCMAPRNNILGHIYQLPTVQTVVAMQHSQQNTPTCVQSEVTCCVSSSTIVPSSVPVATSKPSVNMNSVAKALITPSLTQAEPERAYVAGRRYTMTKKDGVRVEGIWDGKYLTVLPTTSSSSTAADMPPGQFRVVVQLFAELNVFVLALCIWVGPVLKTETETAGFSTLDMIVTL